MSNILTQSLRLLQPCYRIISQVQAPMCWQCARLLTAGNTGVNNGGKQTHSDDFSPNDELNKYLFPNVSGDIENNYSGEQKGKILDFFNSSQPIKMRKVKNISSIVALSVVEHREENGSFTCLSDILKVRGFGQKTLTKVCDAILDTDLMQLEGSKVKFSVAKPIPPLGAKKKMEVDSVVSVEVHLDQVYWARITRNCEVTHWNRRKIFEQPTYRFDHIDYPIKVREAIEKIPKGSIYVFPKRQKLMKTKSPKYIMDRQVLEAFFMMMLNKDLMQQKHAGKKEIADLNKVFYMPSSNIAQLFDLAVGSEVVSGKNLSDSLVRGEQRSSDQEVEDQMFRSHDLMHLKLQNDMKDYYLNSCENVDQEKLTNCLLLADAFLQLYIID